MKIKHRLLALLVAAGTPARAQTIATLEVKLNHPNPGISTPASTSLDGLTALPDSVLQLVEVRGRRRTPVPCQVENGRARVLHWLVPAGGERKRRYELVAGPGVRLGEAVRVADEPGALLVKAGARRLFRYNYQRVSPPPGVDTVYRRSGFIHPLWSPHGQELTRVHAPDHYHHYGIWNPWTHVLFEGDTVDFWNVQDRKGTTRFAKLLTAAEGPVYGEYRVLHEQVAYRPGRAAKTALREVQTVRVYAPTGPDAYLVDLTIELSCASASPVRLLNYRYGGLAWRAPETWTKANSEVLTSAGKTRRDADGSTARWVQAQGPLGPDYGGLALLSHPANYNHPEPLRVWPENTKFKGDVFINFSPTKGKDWLLLPGRTYTLRYRLLVYNGYGRAEQAEQAWRGYSPPPTVVVRRR